jgi:hypothetical protein
MEYLPLPRAKTLLQVVQRRYWPEDSGIYLSQSYGKIVEEVLELSGPSCFFDEL